MSDNPSANLVEQILSDMTAPVGCTGIYDRDFFGANQGRSGQSDRLEPGLERNVARPTAIFSTGDHDNPKFVAFDPETTCDDYRRPVLPR